MSNPTSPNRHIFHIETERKNNLRFGYSICVPGTYNEAKSLAEQSAQKKSDIYQRTWKVTSHKKI